MEKTDQLKKKDKQIDEMQTRILEMQRMYDRLMDNYRQLYQVIQGYKDPAAMADFRRTLTQMEKDLNYLTQEKEVQYKHMEDAITLMHDLNFLNFNRFAEQEARM